MKLPLVSNALLSKSAEVTIAEPWLGKRWLEVLQHPGGGSLPFRCHVCRRFGGLAFLHKGDWKWTNLLRHQHTKRHGRSVWRLLGLDGADSPGDGQGAPSSQQFAAIWKNIREGRAHRSGCEAVGSKSIVSPMLC